MATQMDKWTTEFRAELGRFWDSYQALLKANDEYLSRGWSGAVTQPDLADENYDITPAQIANGLGTVAAVDTLMDAGDKTNVALLIKR